LLVLVLPALAWLFCYEQEALRWIDLETPVEEAAQIAQAIATLGRLHLVESGGPLGVSRVVSTEKRPGIAPAPRAFPPAIPFLPAPARKENW
jgi:hypothetical protein